MFMNAGTVFLRAQSRCNSELHPTDHLAAGLLDPMQGRFMGFDRES
jgi:hypothetical protein